MWKKKEDRKIARRDKKGLKELGAIERKNEEEDEWW